MMARTALYRHFDADGVLLYVGISLDAVSRLKQHQAGSSWSQQIASVKVEWHETRITALAAEQAAIETEDPVFNIIRPGYTSADGVRPTHIETQVIFASSSQLPRTDAEISKLPAPLSGERSYWHPHIKGFHLRILPTGNATWRYTYRDVAKVKRKITLGKHPAVSLVEATALAKALAGQIAISRFTATQADPEANCHPSN